MCAIQATFLERKIYNMTYIAEIYVINSIDNKFLKECLFNFFAKIFLKTQKIE